MKIVAIETTAVLIPASEPLADTLDPISKGRPAVAISVYTDDGIEGVGISYFGAALTPALKLAIDLLGALVIGENPLDTVAIAAKMHAAAGSAGPTGLYALAAAGIDIALWDIKGKAFGQPLWRLIGGSGNPVRTYASGALRRTLTLTELGEAASRLVDRGFTEMKMHVALLGNATAADEAARVRVVREAVGQHIVLTADANQRWRPDQAIAIGQRLAEFELGWLEDVTAHDDVPGQARVAASLATPVAAGELIYGLRAFRHLIEARAVDIVMIDLFRAGGITPWLKIAALAEACNLPVISHLIPEVHVHLIGSVPNGLTVEFMPWFSILFEESPWPKKGMLEMPQTPGLGLSWDRNSLAHHAIG